MQTLLANKILSQPLFFMGWGRLYAAYHKVTGMIAIQSLTGWPLERAEIRAQGHFIHICDELDNHYDLKLDQNKDKNGFLLRT